MPSKSPKKSIFSTSLILPVKKNQSCAPWSPPHVLSSPWSPPPQRKEINHISQIGARNLGMDPSLNHVSLFLSNSQVSSLLTSNCSTFILTLNCIKDSSILTSNCSKDVGAWISCAQRGHRTKIIFLMWIRFPFSH